jgi:hypothetical protein
MNAANGSAVKIDASSDKRYIATSFGRKTAHPVLPSMQDPSVNTGIYPSYLLLSSSAKVDHITSWCISFGRSSRLRSQIRESDFLYSIQIYIKSTTHILSSYKKWLGWVRLIPFSVFYNKLANLMVLDR